MKYLLHVHFIIFFVPITLSITTNNFVRDSGELTSSSSVETVKRKMLRGFCITKLSDNMTHAVMMTCFDLTCYSEMIVVFK